jgi:hypothetical protein
MSEIDASLEELKSITQRLRSVQTTHVSCWQLVRHHRDAGPVHLKYGHSRADCAGGDGHRQGPRRLSLSICGDRRAGRVRGFHDAYFLTGEHAGGGTRTTSFGDFVKAGVPFTIIVAIVSALLVPIFLPFQ